MMASSIKIDGTPYQYEFEAEAGVYPDTGTRWWGTRLRYRPGLSGRWRYKILVDVHPLDFRAVMAALEAVVRDDADAQ